jgi:alkanesulfonate monooxygenase SsuD/methylene tetrahydromethanopterin reductase-like flavin-dependent oxidoreductase (luciferase family)
MPDYFVVAENLATLHKLGAIGWFAESTCCHPREEMVELKVYLWGRLSFDPTLNITAVTEHFLTGFYSPSAAPHVMQYLQVLDTAMRARGAQRPGDPRIWPTNSKTKRTAAKWAWGPFAAMFSNATVLDAATALKLAAAAAEPSSRYSVRVAQAKTALQLVAFYRWDEFKAYAKASGHAWPFAAELSTEFEDFVAALSTPSQDGPAVSKVEASLAPDGSPNKGGSVTFKELRTQLGI